jgi:dihydrofolate synthase/folylpolyglutamate synthase
MNYLQSTVYLESLLPTPGRPMLGRISVFLKEHGQPQEMVPVIHVGGTNGKGSTVAMLASILQAAGKKVGRYTGPHILRWNERINLNGEEISDEAFASYATGLRALSEEFGKRHPELGRLSWFELLTCMAFFYFAEQKVDVAVIEVGLGGRFDATNVCASPIATAVTNTELDHMRLLGNKLEDIAREKSGIIKSNVPLVTACNNEVLSLIEKAALEANAPFVHCQLPGQINFQQNGGVPSNLWREITPLAEVLSHTGLAGEHQKLNALVALGCLLSSGANKDMGDDFPAHCKAGLQNVYWPGRLQYLPKHNVVFDVAHNPAGAKALAVALKQLFPQKKRSYVFSCFADKQAEGLLEYLIEPGDRFFGCEAEVKRQAYPQADLIDMAKKMGASCVGNGKTIADSLDQALSTRAADEIVVVTGSFATVRESMYKLGWASVEDGRQVSLKDWHSLCL